MIRRDSLSGTHLAFSVRRAAGPKVAVAACITSARRMTEVTPPTPKADACPPKAQGAGASLPAATGFQDSLANAVALATPAPGDGAAAAEPAAGAAGAARPKEPPAGPPPDNLPAGHLDGTGPAAPNAQAAVATLLARADSRPGKDAARGSRKDRPLHTESQPAAQAGQLTVLQAVPNACAVAAVVPLPSMAIPPLVGVQAGAAGSAGAGAAAAAIGEATGGPRKSASELPVCPAPSAAGKVEPDKKTVREAPVASGAAAKPLIAIGAAPSSPAPGVTLSAAAVPAPTHLALPLVSAPASPTASAPLAPAPAQSPAGQVAPVMVSLAAGPAGTHHLVMRLDPPELGRVEIRVEHGPDTGASVEVVADRPGTLALLRQDAPALHQALTDAGIPTQRRSLTMQLGHQSGQFAAGQGNGGQGGWTPRRSGSANLSTGSESARPSGSHFLVAPRGLLSALDITA